LTQKDNKKAHISNTLAGGEIQALQSADADQHRDRITRFGLLKHRSKLQEQFLWTQVDFKENNENSIKALKAATKLKGCGQFLLFHNYYTINQIKLAKAHYCAQHLLCPMCAGVRAAKSMKRYLERIHELMSLNPRLKPVLITFTVLNGEDLEERALHLMKSFRTLIKRRQDWLKKGRGFNEFCKIDGAMYSYENTYNEKTGEWHPHIHMFALVDQWIDQQEFAEYWESITGDSMIVDVRRAKKQKGFGYSKAAAEVCKYALKFGDLSVEKTWEAFKVLKGKRLTGAFGLLWGVKIPDTMTDDMPDDKTLPYLEMLYKFVYGKSSYYDLAATRHVEPQIDDNDDEAGATSEEAEKSVALKNVVRKKQHWQVPPVTRVRVRERIRRWDGFLCVMRM